MSTMTIKGKTMRSVDVDWKEFYYTNCPMVSPSNVDQELGWVKEEFKKIGVAYKYFRSTVENNWYPHYVHNLDNLMRYGGCHPAIHVQADVRRTRAYWDDAGLRRRRHDGARPRPHLQNVAPEGQEDRHLQEPEHHQERLVARPGRHGIETMLMLNDMTTRRYRRS